MGSNIVSDFERDSETEIQRHFGNDLYPGWHFGVTKEIFPTLSATASQSQSNLHRHSDVDSEFTLSNSRHAAEKPVGASKQGSEGQYGKSPVELQAAAWSSSKQQSISSQLHPQFERSETIVERSWVALSLSHLCMHTIAIASSTASIGLCASRTYFSGPDTPNINLKLNAFQFVAALHAAITIASTSIIAIHHLIYELTIGDGLPCAFLGHPYQLNCVTLLFESHFWLGQVATFRSKRQLLFGVGIMFTIGLQILVGPSSAILFVPQLGLWNMPYPWSTLDGIMYIFRPYHLVWPIYLNDSFVPEQCNVSAPAILVECPYANLPQIKLWAEFCREDALQVNVTAMVSSSQVRKIVVSRSEDQEPWYSAASSPMHAVLQGFGRSWTEGPLHLYKQLSTKFSQPKITLRSMDPGTPLMAPLVQTQCSDVLNLSNNLDHYQQVTFPGSQLKGVFGQNYPDITRQINVTDYRFPGKVEFTNISEGANKSVTGILYGSRIITPTFDNGNLSGSDIFPSLIACTMIAHWIPTQFTSYPYTTNEITMDHSDPLRAAANKALMTKAIPISIDLTYLNKVNAPLTGEGPAISVKVANVFEYIISTMNPYNFPDDPLKKWSSAFAALTSLQIADALSRINARAGDAWAQFDRLNDPANLRVQNEIETRPDKYTPVQMYVQKFGYGWSLESTTRKFAFTVIAMHVLLTLAHIVLVTKRRVRIKHWTNLTELIGLANRSPLDKNLSVLGSRSTNHEAATSTVMIRSCADKYGGEAYPILTTSNDYEKMQVRDIHKTENV